MPGPLALAIPLMAVPVSAAPGESTEPATNPDLQKACGLDVLMVLDELSHSPVESNNVPTVSMSELASDSLRPTATEARSCV